MKNFSYFVLFVLLTILPSTRILAQGTTMKPILMDAINYIQAAENNGYEIVRMEFDIVTASIKSSYRTLQQGWTYGVVAFGDYRISDIDIAIYKDVDGTWALVKKDDDAQSNAALDITPSSSGMYRIDIIAYKFVEGYSAAHYGMLIIHE